MEMGWRQSARANTRNKFGDSLSGNFVNGSILHSYELHVFGKSHGPYEMSGDQEIREEKLKVYRSRKNRLERERLMKMNRALVILKNSIPSLKEIPWPASGPKCLKKVDILLGAIEYINKLQGYLNEDCLKCHCEEFSPESVLSATNESNSLCDMPDSWLDLDHAVDQSCVELLSNGSHSDSGNDVDDLTNIASFLRGGRIDIGDTPSTSSDGNRFAETSSIYSQESVELWRKDDVAETLSESKDSCPSLEYDFPTQVRNANTPSYSDSCSLQLSPISDSLDTEPMTPVSLSAPIPTTSFEQLEETPEFQRWAGMEHTDSHTQSVYIFSSSDAEEVELLKSCLRERRRFAEWPPNLLQWLTRP